MLRISTVRGQKCPSKTLILSLTLDSRSVHWIPHSTSQLASRSVKPFSGCLQLPTDFQEISRIHFSKNSRTFLRDKPYNVEMQVKFVMSVDEHVLMSCDQRSSLCLRSQWSCLPEQFPIYTALKSLMCENCIANYKIFQEHQLNFRRFPVFPRSNFKFREISRRSRSSGSCKGL